MEENNVLYRMHTLMNYSEIDAFAAQKKASSKKEYFARLTEFVDTVPGHLEELKAPSDPTETIRYLNVIDTLQTQLLAIGSPSLMWMAEKAAELARNKDKKACANETHVLATKIKALCSRIEEARFEAGGETITETIPKSVEPQPLLAEANRPKAPIKSEPFEKLGLLIENFEMDDALETLRSLMNFSYNDTIDQSLRSIYSYLSEYDFSASENGVQQLLDTINSMERDTDERPKMKILAIDDMPDVLNTIKSVLKNTYNVYGVTNHMAALKFLTSNSADLILLDIEMPDMNGFALLSIIRKIEVYKNTPVLFLTGSVSVENVKKSVEAGGNDFIKKPVDVSILLGKVQKHIGA